MTTREAARLDHAYADGMRAALAMAAQGAEDKARQIADRLSAEALHALLADGETTSSKEGRHA